ncbi:flagellar assembly protein FliW [Paenibacillus pedocola]|uniref:flagellar assembly protein FliW n=1 Tax=Paenibacillus pedocola TaxID=3242193 RepID=UPI002877CFFB|nr:flagellar assembly protein FliW [Paenibacillus typhae]
MIIDTLSWGEVEVNSEQVFHFPKGIPGFEEESEFALISIEDHSFWYLQSTKEKSLSFLLSDPFLFYPSYEFDLPDDEAEELEIQSQLIVRCVITLKDKVEETTINLLAPLVFNPELGVGKQIVLHNSPYHTKHSLLTVEPNVDGKAGD